MYRRILALILSLALLMPGLALAESLPYVEDCALLPAKAWSCATFCLPVGAHRCA